MMKDEDKTKAVLIKELKTLRKEREKSALKGTTEHKQITKKSEKRFKELFNHISSGVAVYEAKDNGKDFIIRDFNRAAKKIEKVKKEDIIGKSVLRVFPEVKDFGLFKIFQEVYKTGKPQHHPVSFYQDQRITGWRENYVYKLPSGEVVAVYDDITERIQAEKELKDSEDWLKILFDYAPNAYYIHDLKGNFIDGNLAAQRIIGYKKKELIRKSFVKLKLLSTKDIPKATKSFAKTIIGLPTGPDEYVLNRKDKSTVAVEISHYPVKIKGKTYVLGMARDITERKKIDENIRRAKDELQMIMDSVPAIIFYKDIEGRIVRANKTLANSLKMPVKDMIGKTTEELFPREQAEKMRRDDQEVVISRKPKRDIIQPYTTPDGIRWLTIDKIPYKDKEGKVIGVIDLSKDITVQRKSEQELQQTHQRLKKTTDAAIDTMSKIIEAKDPYTSGHQRRVCQLAVPLAQELGLSQDKIEGIRVASLIHDIGKIGLPTEILSKPIKLSEIEFSLIKNHSQTGYDILKSIDFPYPVAKIVLQHHERLNGSGYPNSLKGDEILLEAKIIGVADVVEAMSSHRPYRPALGIDKALEEITQNKGILYDPEVVDVCLKLFKEKGFKFR